MGGKVLRTYVADPSRDLQTLKVYRLNKILMRMIGQWPFSPLWQQQLGICVALCLVGGVYVLELVHAIQSRSDIDAIIECLTSVIVKTSSLIKLCTLLFGAKAVRKLFVIMQNDWNTRTGEVQKRILEEYAGRSESLTFGYMVYMYITGVAYLLLPTMPALLNIIKPLNVSRPQQFPSHAEYFLEDPMDHYFILLLHQVCGSFGSVSCLVICDTMYATYVQHACGIFATLNYELEHLVDEEICDEDFNAPKENNRVYKKITNCVEQHQKAIKFAEFIESTYCISNLLLMIINMVIISVTGVQTAIHLNEPDISVRFGTLTVAELIHVLFNSLPGQALYDHSTMVFYATYNCKWYAISKKSRDMLRMIMFRSRTPCQLTAGKLYVMDLQRFSAVIQTSMSYFTVLTSMR